MKKLIILAFLIVGSLSANAQLLRFGIKAGPNFSDMDGKDYDSKTRTGFHFGAVVEIKASPNFSIQPELLYSMQGSKVKVSNLKDENINYDYVTVPVVLKYYILSDLLSLEAGPQFAFLVNDNANKFNLGDSNTFDFSVLGGLGIDITKHIFGQARYVVGLTDASKDAIVNKDIKNKVIQLSVGYKF